MAALRTYSVNDEMQEQFARRRGQAAELSVVNSYLQR